MASLTKLAEELSDYGITYNQAKVYVAAAKLGIASVSQISNKSDVPREEVYRLLPKLEKLGLIEKTVERPMRIKATNLRSVLSILINHKKERALRNISELEAKREQILEDFRTFNLELKPKEEAHLTMIMQRQAIIQKIVSMIETAKETLTLSVCRDHFIHIFTNYSLPIKGALNRGLEFRAILEKDEYEDVINELVNKFETCGVFKIRFVDQQQSHYFLVDNKEALVSTSMECSSLGDRGYLWTDDVNLVRLIVENFDNIWLTSQDIEAIKMEDNDEKLRRYLNTLKPTEHLLFIYRSMKSKYNVLCNYLKVGLENDEAVVYVSSVENQRQVRDLLKRSDIEVEKNEKAGALRILGFDEFYIIDGKFSITTTTGLIEQMYDDALEKGFRGCRVFGDMSCFFQHGLNNELIEYEKSLHRIFDSPIIAMCAYDADVFDKCDSAAEEYKDLLKAHKKVLFMGQGKQLDKFEIR